MKIGIMEIIVVLIVALLVIGPDKFPEYAKKFGVAMKEFKKASSEISKDIREEVVEPLDDLQKPIREAVEPLTDLSKEVQDSLSGVTKGLNDIGKPKPKAAKTAKPAEAAAAAESTAPAENAAPAESAAPAANAEIKETPVSQPQTQEQSNDTVKEN